MEHSKLSELDSSIYSIVVCSLICEGVNPERNKESSSIYMTEFSGSLDAASSATFSSLLRKSRKLLIYCKMFDKKFVIGAGSCGGGGSLE
jgi:hypothetical protein